MSVCVAVVQPARGEGRAPSAPEWIWWEAETPTATNFPADNPFKPENAEAAAALSGRAWIGASDPGHTLFLTYDVTAARGGAFTFYARKFWFHGPFRWRFDDQPWQECGHDVALINGVPIAKFVEVDWVRVGTVTLGSGKHTLRIELTENAGASAFDCFLLTTAPFTPRGTLKPGEHRPAPAGWFAFDPDADPFEPAALDLRTLNEPFAGKGGFIAARGSDFVHQATGRTIRFWGVNVGHTILNHDPDSLGRFARHLAKVGVNLVRLHGPLWADGDVTKPDLAKVKKIHVLLAALKKQGVYLEISSYFPIWMQPKGVAGIDGYNGDQNAFAIAFFNRRFQEMQRGWWRALLSSKDPDSGLTLAEDPALAFVEVQNEDSLFFWTFAPYESVPAAEMALLEAQFGDWLKAKDGGVAQAFTRWGGGRVRGDAADTGRAGIIPLGDMLGRRDARARDTIDFLATVERRYYDEMVRYLKHDLGFKSSVVASNWITADGRSLGPIDKWANAGADFMDRHGYYGGPHDGERASWALSNGDRYLDASALRFETGKGKDGDVIGAVPDGLSFELPIMDVAYNGKPSITSEINWPMPNRYRADMVPLCAAYGALQGSDGFIFFATDDIEWSSQLAKFSIADPSVMGQFPAAALIFRSGLVKTADAVAHIEMKLGDLIARSAELPLVAPESLDELRRRDVPADPSGAGRSQAARSVPPSIDPLAFLAGRVEVNVSAAGGPSRSVALDTLIDRGGKTARSTTGQLRWDWGRGVATIDAPAAQGVTGFLAHEGAVKLGDVTVESAMEYGSVLVVALDDRPLATSRRILVQVMSEDSNSGWSTTGDRPRKLINSIGASPIVVRNIEGRVSFKRADLKFRPLDFNGYEAPPQPPAASKSGTLTLRPSTLYYLVEAPATPH